MKREIRIPDLEETDLKFRKIQERMKLLSDIIEQQEKLLVCYRLQRRGEPVKKIIDKLSELKERRTKGLWEK